MEGAGPRITLGLQLAVVLAALLSTGGLLVFDNHPTPRAPIVLASVNWTERWDSNQSAGAFQFPALLGDCSNTALINTSGSNFTCVFVTRPVDEPGNSTSGSYGQIQISAVSVNTPFSLVGYVGVAGSTCANCEEVGVTIGLPSIGGTYSLTGIVYFSVAQ
jgi:hypothetical protein